MFKNDSSDSTDTTGPIPECAPAARREMAGAVVAKLRSHWPFTVEAACAAQMLAQTGSGQEEGKGGASFVT